MSINEKGTSGSGGGGGGGGQPTNISSNDFKVDGAGYSKTINLKPQDLGSAVSTSQGKFDVKIDGDTITKDGQGKLSAKQTPATNISSTTLDVGGSGDNKTINLKTTTGQQTNTIEVHDDGTFDIKVDKTTIDTNSNGQLYVMDGVIGGLVKSVDGVSPNADGNVELTGEDIPFKDETKSIADEVDEKSYIATKDFQAILFRDIEANTQDLAEATISFDTSMRAEFDYRDDMSVSLLNNKAIPPYISGAFKIQHDADKPGHDKFTFEEYDSEGNIVNTILIFGVQDDQQENFSRYDWITPSFTFNPNKKFYLMEKPNDKLPSFLMTAQVVVKKDLKVDCEFLTKDKVDTFSSTRIISATAPQLIKGDQLRRVDLKYTRHSETVAGYIQNRVDSLNFEIKFANGTRFYKTSEANSIMHIHFDGTPVGMSDSEICMIQQDIVSEDRNTLSVVWAPYLDEDGDILTIPIPDKDGFVVTDVNLSTEDDTLLTIANLFVFNKIYRVSKIDARWLLVNGLYNGNVTPVGVFLWQIFVGDNISRCAISFLTQARNPYIVSGEERIDFADVKSVPEKTGYIKATPNNLVIKMPNDDNEIKILDNGTWNMSSFNFNDYHYKSLIVTSKNIKSNSWLGMHFALSVMSSFNTVGSFLRMGHTKITEKTLWDRQ